MRRVSALWRTVLAVAVTGCINSCIWGDFGGGGAAVGRGLGFVAAIEQRLQRTEEEMRAAREGKCVTTDCWEEKMPPVGVGGSFVDVLLGGLGTYSSSSSSSSSDLVGRLMGAVAVAYHAGKRQGEKKSQINASVAGLAAGCVLGVVIMAFGGAVVALYVCFEILRRPSLTYPPTPSPSSSTSSSSLRPVKQPPMPSIKLTVGLVWAVVLTAVAGYTRLADLSNPPFLIFDEVHFGKFMNGHITGEFYFDIHPPIVKLVMAWVVTTMCPWYQGEQPFRDIGEAYLPDSPVRAMRLLPALASTLLVPVAYATSRDLGASWWGAALAALLTCFDCLLATEGRVLTTDTQLLLFIACSLWFHVRTEASKIFSTSWHINCALTGIFLGLTVCTKWIGLNALGVVGICTAVDVIQRGHLGFDPRNLRAGFQQHLLRRGTRDLATRLALLLGIPAVMYYVSFYMWIRTCPKWGEFGPWHMTEAFRAHLIDAPAGIKKDIPKESFFQTFVHFNTAMFTGNRDVGKGQKGHPWESWWFQWPLNLRGLACWSQPSKFDRALGNAFERHVYFLGNPFVNWICFALLWLSLYTLVSPRKLPMGRAIPQYAWKLFMLHLGFWSGFLPYVAVRRSCFIYHYMPPMYFAVIMSALVADHILFRYFADYRVKLVVLVAVAALLAWSFHFFSILTYGTPVTKKQYESRIWLNGWR